MTLDPLVTNPDSYPLVVENDRVRVLEFEAVPTQVSSPHVQPDSVMVTLTAFSRRLHAGGRTRDVERVNGMAQWLPAQEHYGENIGATPTHVLFIELKDPPEASIPVTATVVGSGMPLGLA